MKIIHKTTGLFKLVLVAVLAVFVVSACSVSGENVISLQSAELTVTAERETLAGLELDSGFYVQRAGISAQDLGSSLTITPSVRMELEDTKNGVHVRLLESLAPNTIYNVKIAGSDGEPPRSWAFQTKDTFRVTKTLPFRSSTYVPVNSGLELYFSQPVSAEGIEKTLTIVPEMEGRVQQVDEKTVVFIPSERFDYDAKYTVNLDADTSSLSGDTLETSYSFYFTTENKPGSSGRLYFDLYGNLNETFTTTDPVTFKILASDEFNGVTVDTKIYRYASMDDYMDAFKSYYDNNEETMPSDGLSLVTEFYGELFMDSNYLWRTAFFEMPENPGAGWYLVDITTVSDNEDLNGRHTQKLVQVTDISVYMQASEGQALFWLNDAATGEHIEGAEITFLGETGVTDENGLVLMSPPIPTDEQRQKIGIGSWQYTYYRWYDSAFKYELSINHGEQGFGDFVYYNSSAEPSHDEQYYTYVYTDRSAYQPTDTVRFWGVVAPRRDGVETPETIILDWDGGIELTVAPDGTFQGEMRLDKHSSEWVSVRFTLDGKSLCYTYVTVMEYVKPTYTAEITLDKAYYRQNDTVTATVQTNFFDGTPASGIEAGFNYGFRGTDMKTLYTDKSGQCESTQPVISYDASFWRPISVGLTVKIGGVEDTYIYEYRNFTVFPRDYLMKASVMKDGDEAWFSLSGWAIDYDKVPEYMEDHKRETLYGEAAELSGTATLIQTVYTRRKTGEYYDFINKKVVEQYTYDGEERTVYSIPVQTENGSLTSDRLTLDYGNGDVNYTYKVILDLTAPDGSAFSETVYVPGKSYDYYSQPTRTQYYFYLNDGDSRYTAEYGNYFYYSKTSSYYSVGDEINAWLANQDGESPKGGRMLWNVVGAEHNAYGVTEDNAVSLEFKPEYAPNSWIAGAYFDGKHIYMVNISYINYYYPERMLNIDITPDKERYAPGETAELVLNITDKDGSPVEAAFVLSAADEAAFAVMEQTVNPVGSIYSQRYTSITQYVSYTEPSGDYGGAEEGEGGSEGIRTEFVDTAAFISGATDENGQAVVSFKLPDNLTSWRLTGVAYADRMMGKINLPITGARVSNIQVGLPFFINQILNSRSLEGDSIGISLRAAGTAVSPDDYVDYTVTITGEGVSETKTVSGEAGNHSLLLFGPYPEGMYTVLTKASGSGYTDAMEVTIEVADSALITHRTISGDLSEGLTLTARRFPVRISLYDSDNRLYYNILYKMLCSNGNRLDQVLARALAGRLLNEAIGETVYNEAMDVSESVYNGSTYFGGLRLLPYGNADVLLTAKAVAAAPELLGTSRLKVYFTDIINNKDSSVLDIAGAYMGLGALKEPVLTDLREAFEAAKEKGNLAFEETLYLATGLALIGDTEPVYQWFEECVALLLAEGKNGVAPVNYSGDYEENYRLTAGAAALACIINHPAHKELLVFLCDYRSALYLPILELAVYTGTYSPKSESPASLTYNLNGETVELTFNKRNYAYVELNEKQLREANFTVTNGSVGYTAYYSGGLEEAEAGLPHGVNINVSVSPENPSTGDKVTVTTTVTFEPGIAEPGSYHIRQTVPSGLRFVSAKLVEYNYYSVQQNHRMPFWYNTGEGGLINFYIGTVSAGVSDLGIRQVIMPASVTFSYEARAVLPGEYIVEATAISRSGDDALYAGERSFIIISE